MTTALVPALNAEAWRWIGIGSGAVSAAFLVYALVGTPRGAFFVTWGRYVAYLTRRLRRLHVFEGASRIASAQIALLFLVGALAAFRVCPYWYLFILVIGFGPALVIEKRTRDRVARLDVQADAFCLALADRMAAHIRSVTRQDAPATGAFPSFGIHH
jgi:hypothetical protein